MLPALMLVASIASATPQVEATNDPFEAPTNYVVPAVETGALLVGINRVNYWLLDGDWAGISWGSITNNINHGLQLDNDDLFVNFIGHPFQGSIPFDAARSMGLNFWTASAYTFAADLIWEFLAEIQSASTNDLVETALGGVVWGESLHRLSRLILGHGGLPWLARVALAFLIDPAGAINSAAIGRLPPGEETPPWHGRLYVGGLFLGNPRMTNQQALLGVDIRYGFPDAASSGCVRPFDVMDIRAGVGLRSTATIDGFARGLVAGCHLGDLVPGAAGLFALTDFHSAPGFRLAGSGVGAGALAQVRLGPARLRGTALFGGMAMAGAGLAEDTDYHDPDGGVPPAPSRYSLGPGLQAVADVELDLAERVSVRAVGRSWWISAITPLKGTERVDTGSLGVFTWLPGGQIMGAEVTADRRLAAAGRDPPLAGWTARVVWGARLGPEPGP